MIEHILHIDREIFLYLNNLGSPAWDSFWLFVTNKYVWIPMYLWILYLLFKKYSLRQAVTLLLIIAVLVAFTDQFVNLVKYSTARIRPCNDDSFQNIARIVKHSGGYSFFSGHATNSTAVSTFVVLFLRKYNRHITYIFIWPVLFAYSRIYLGVHYPLDVLTGIIAGVLIALFFRFVSLLIFPELKQKI